MMWIIHSKSPQLIYDKHNQRTTQSSLDCFSLCGYFGLRTPLLMIFVFPHQKQSYDEVQSVLLYHSFEWTLTLMRSAQRGTTKQHNKYCMVLFSVAFLGCSIPDSFHWTVFGLFCFYFYKSCDSSEYSCITYQLSGWSYLFSIAQHLNSLCIQKKTYK